MNTKYISPRKEDNKWIVQNSKSEKATKAFITQVEAIDYAASLKSTKIIMVQRKDGKFRKLTGWDQTNTESDLNDVPPKQEVKKVQKKKDYIWISITLILFAIIGVLVGLAVGGVF